MASEPRPLDLPHVAVLPSDPDFNQNPYREYANWHQTASTFWWDAYGHACFAGFETVNAILRDRRFGREILHVASREELGIPEPPDHVKPFVEFDSRSMLEREPPVHTRLRRLVNRAFVSRIIERLRPQIEKLTHELIDGFVDKGEVDLIREFATPVPVTVIAEMLGVPPGHNQQLLDWSHAMVAMYQFNRSRSVEDAAVKATAEFSSFINHIVDNRQPGERADLIGTLLKAEVDGDALTRDELVTTCILLLNAGHEATVHAIGNGVKAILESGLDVASLTRPEVLASTIEEVLRIDPPLHMFTRWVLEDCVIDGVQLRKGDTVGLLLGAANHDPTRFATPQQFSPLRENLSHTSFGAGIHFCVGAPLARLELAVALPILFERLPNLKIAKPPVYADRYHFHGLEQLQLSW